MSNGLRLDLRGLTRGFLETNTRMDSALDMFAENAAVKLQDYARDNAKWTDRTGHARQRLVGKSYRIGNVRRIELSHGVDYGMWLELAHEQRFAILEPTIRICGQGEIMPAFNRLMERFGG